MTLFKKTLDRLICRQTRVTNSEVMHDRQSKPSSRWFSGLADQRGASLVEIVVATFILSIVAIGMAEFFAGGRLAFDQEESKRVATLLAQEALERTTALSYVNIASWSETRTIANVDYSIAVTATEDLPQPDIITLQCDVTWDAVPTGTRTATLVTFVY
ncbi:prepilin-type N-terminal cleavage/methylation domain-containing protein [bacterium]|nr:prepilin-type N-terminal cleavage/methylation domain-containing protein [bacterium]